MDALFIPVFVLVVAEWVLSLSWSPFYYRVGVPLFATTMRVQTEQLDDRLAVHFQVVVVDEAVWTRLNEQSAADTLLQMLAGQFARLFVNSDLQDVYGGDGGVTAVA